MGQLDPLIEQKFFAQSQRIQEQLEINNSELDGSPEYVRHEIEQTLTYYFGFDKRHAHPQSDLLFPRCNRVTGDYLSNDFFQFYSELSAARLDNRALGSENAAAGGYRLIVSAPYNPHPISETTMKAYERVGFLFQGKRLLAYTHFLDLGDGKGPISRDDDDELDKGAIFLDDKVVAIVPQEGGKPQAGVFASGASLKDFLEVNLYDELEQLSVTAHQETTPLDPSYMSRGDKVKHGVKSLGKGAVVFAVTAAGRRSK